MADFNFKCTVIRNTFSNKDNDYRIYAVDSDDMNIKRNKYGNVTILGILPELEIGVEYMIKGTEKMGNYGAQYQVVSCVRDVPMSEIGIRLFLNETLARSQVDELLKHYPNIIDIVMHNRMSEIDLSLLHNIKEERMKVIKRKIIENFVFAKMIEQFQGLIDFKIIKALHDEYDDVGLAKEQIKNNPYGVMCDVGELSFKDADKVLLKFEREYKKLENPPLEFDEPLITSKTRIEQCIVYCLRENEYQGNTKMNYEMLKSDVKSLTPECFHRFEEVIGNDKLFYINNGYVSTIKAYESELNIATKLLSMRNSENLWTFDYEKYENELGLTDQQLNVIKNVALYNVSICNGNAGVGKTMSTIGLIDVLKQNEKYIKILSPTGKASKVISNYTKHPASTIHREMFSMGERSLINADIIIIDEVSMIDIYLFNWLLSAVDFTRTKILLIGDDAQLPSIGLGNLLSDLLRSQVLPTSILDKVFRYGEGGIMTVATNTRLGQTFLESKTGIQVLGIDKGYTYIPSNSASNAVASLSKVYEKLLSTYSTEDIMILSPYNIGEAGTKLINETLKPIANPSSINNETFLETPNTKFHVGDMVLQTKNNYKSPQYMKGCGYNEDDSIEVSYEESSPSTQTLICNGDTGKLLKIYKNYALIDFEGTQIVYSKFDLNQCLLSTSISIHKSQGSGCKIVIIITLPEHSRMMNSNLLYVAQTRAKEKLFHIGEIDTINNAVGIKVEYDRQTNLCQFLTEGEF
jgi:RecD/TraA family predicted helicase